MEIRKEKAVVVEADEDEEIWPVSSHIHKIRQNGDVHLWHWIQDGEERCSFHKPVPSPVYF